MRVRGNNLTLEGLRSELERFARETLQSEISGLRDHIDKAVKQELPGKPTPAGRFLRMSSKSSIGEEWNRKYSPWHQEAEELPFGPMASLNAFANSTPTRLSAQTKGSVVYDRPSELASWAQRRTGFSQSSSGGRRVTRRGGIGGGALPETQQEIYSRLSRHTDASGAASATSEASASEPEDNGDTAARGSRDLAMTANERQQPSLWERLIGIMGAVVSSDTFDFFIGGAILANAALIGLETEYMAANWTTDTPKIFQQVDLVFCTIFLVEVVMRWCVTGIGFFRDAGWKWNCFDLLVVVFQVIDEGLRAMAQADHVQQAQDLQEATGNQLNATRILRLFRLIRLLRLTRLMYLLGGLRMLVVSILDSLRSLAWTLVLLSALTFVFGVFLTQLVTDYKVRHNTEEAKEEMEELLKFFGTLDRSILCLYETISEGIHWHEVLEPLMKHCGAWLALVFVVYMSFTLFALMNVVTGVFCESAIRTAADDQKEILAKQMHELFMEADDDGSGTISVDEFESHLKDPQMLSYLKAIDVNPDEARHLFALLDAGDTGEIEAAELVNGCLRLQGSAKAIELAAFIQEHKMEFQKLTEHNEQVERTLSALVELISSKEDRYLTTVYEQPAE